MKTYKWFRWLLSASALTTVMFVMQACYGTPNKPPKLDDETEQANEEMIEVQTPVSDTLFQVE
jgi:hypothetical protein